MFTRPLPIYRSATAVMAAALVLAGCAGAPEPDILAASTKSPAKSPGTSAFPVDIASCDHVSTIETAPEKAVTLNQGATEVMLALGLEDRMAGTAYLDDARPPERWAEAYASVPVISTEYPKREELLAIEPDFVYASYASAFDAKVAGTPAELDALGVASYLSPLGCGDGDLRPEPSFEAVWEELTAVGAAFGAVDEADDLIRDQQAAVADLAEGDVGAGTSIFWYDSGEKTALAGVGDNGPQIVIDAVGATNIFAGIVGGWEDVSWEEVIAADPDVVAFADASWSTAEDKIAFLEGDPVLSQLRAVQGRSYVIVPYSQATPGVTLIEGATSLAEQLTQISS